MTEAMSATQKTRKPKVSQLFSDDLIDQLLAQIQNKDAESILCGSGLAGQLKKRLAERMVAAEFEPSPGHRSDARQERQPRS